MFRNSAWHPKKICVVAACCALAVGTKAQPVPAIEAPQSGESFEQTFRKLPAEKQQELASRLIETGVFLDIPVFWQNCSDLKTTLRTVRHFGEPFSAEMLAALERNLQTKANSGLQTDAAALLYRYNRPAGRAFLLPQLQKGNVAAAKVFALNKDSACLNGILQAFTRANAQESDDQNDPDLVMALGKWRHPRIEAALLRHGKMAVAQQQGGYLNYAPALAFQGSQKAVPLIWQLYKSLPVAEIERSLVAASLIRLRVKESPHLLAMLKKQTQAPEKAFSRHQIIEAMALTDTPEGTKWLCGLIEAYLANPKPPARVPGSLIETTSPQELAVLAAEQLATPQNAALTPLLTRLLARLDQESKTNINAAAWRDNIAMALAPQKSAQRDVAKIMGAAWLQDELTIQSLKPLPHGGLKHRRKS